MWQRIQSQPSVWYSSIGPINLQCYPVLKLRFCQQFKIMFLPLLKNKFTLLL
ncbi:hypothetical protein Hanom_Chr17g01563561 [Helianthus anomalus]